MFVYFWKNYEVRTYEKNRYAFIEYHTYENETETNCTYLPAEEDQATQEPIDTNRKQGNETVMKIIWKLMKYTQGENVEKLKMKFIMPVFVNVETVANETEPNFESTVQNLSRSGKQKVNKIKVMVSLPPEYQSDQKLNPPQPLDQEVQFEAMDQFSCYVK